MADKQYGWLDAETAERLLRGESLDNAVEAAARDEAELLAKTLGTLSVEPPPSSAELPGEAAAMAAFRKARADRGPSVAASGHLRPADAEPDLVRIGAPVHHAAPRSRRGRPLRFGLAAALAFGMVGGVAVAAGTGILPTPFGDDEPRPGASVSAAVTPDRPLVSPSRGGAVESEPTPDGTGGGAADPGTSRDDAGGAPSSDPGSEKDTREGGGSGAWWYGVPSACRDLRDGKQLSADRRRALEGLAGGSTRVGKYCEGVLNNTDGQSGQYEERRDDSGRDRDDNGGQSGSDGDDESHHGAPGGNGSGNGHRQHGGFSTPTPAASSSSPSAPSSEEATLLPKRAAATPDPSPSPSYTAL